MSEENLGKNTVSTKEAAAIVGMTPRSISNYITSGKLSAARNEGGSYQIQLCELYRLWPDKSKKKEENRQEKVDGNSKKFLEAENKHLKEMVDFLNKRLESSEAKEVAAIAERTLLLATITNAQKLLEHQTNKSARKKFLGIF